MHEGGCGFGMQQNVSLSPALQQLKDEHGQLLEQIGQIKDMASTILNKEKTSDVPFVRDLYEVVERFTVALYPHSIREEDYLFTKLASYIGKETGPIAVMEFEHDQAKQKIQGFLDRGELLGNEKERL